MRTLVVIPLQKELDPFLRYCAQKQLAVENDMMGRLPIIRLPELNLTVALGGLGKAQFAVQTQYLLNAPSNWDMVICAGAAGGLSDTLTVGDIVVATATVEHDFKNKFGNPRTPRFDGAADRIDDLKRAASAINAFKVHFGVVASGDEDIIEPEKSRALQDSHGALAVAWEGAGGARACQFNEIPFIEIRAITDAANHNAASDFKSNLDLAMNNLALLITNWLTQPASEQRTS